MLSESKLQLLKGQFDFQDEKSKVMDYKYLFPYETIPKNARILIYGAGELGQAYLRQMVLTKYCDVIGFVDRNYLDYKMLNVPVFSPSEIYSINFDYILLALRAGDFALDVRRTLIRGGIEKEKIVYTGIRPSEIEEVQYNTLYDEDSGLAFRKECISIGMRYGSGLGDAIIQKGFFNELASFSDQILIDIYCPKAREYIDNFYSDCASYNLGINDGGGLYIRNRAKYDLSISAVSIARIDHINENELKNYPDFYEKIMKLKKAIDDYKLEVLPFRNFGTHIRRMQFQKKDCYSSFNYTNDFHADKTRVKLPINSNQHETLERYQLNKYITLNYGTGMSSSGNREIISKQWPMKHYESFVKLFKERYDSIKVVQLGDKSAELIDGVDKHIFGEDIEAVKHILLNAMLHLDSEGGLVHLASQLGTKCVVLFGPTQADYFGYPNNINIISDKCNGCYGLYDTAYHCARNMEKPECMWSIKPEIVMERVEDILKNCEA